MIQLKAFKVEDYEDFNQFVEKNPPRSTEKQSGIIFHEGNILVIYDDGRDNPQDRRAMIKTHLEGTRQKKAIIEIKLETARVALPHVKANLDKIRPKWYRSGMSHKEIRKFMGEEKPAKDGKVAPEFLPAEAIDNMVQKMDGLQGQINSLVDQILLDEHEVARLGYEIEAQEKLLAEATKQHEEK